MKIPAFFKYASLLFLALRAADLVNISAGLWIVPLFVDPKDLGAVLPFVTFATTLATPAFAFAFILMRESNRLAAERKFNLLKSLLCGAFIGTTILVVLILSLAACLVKRFSIEMKVDSTGVALIALAAALLGSVAPIYQDTLNGLKRFGSYGLTEIAAACSRVTTMLIVMPFNGLLGYFCGNAVQPIARIAGSVIALHHDHILAAPANGDSQTYWTRPAVKRLAQTYVGVVIYLLMPMLASFFELSLIRTLLPVDVSGTYYLESRLTDILNYLTLPILLVLFPIAAETARAGRSTRQLVLRCSMATGVGMLTLALVYYLLGRDLLSLFPNADKLVFGPETETQLLLQLGIVFTGAFQTFYTNAEIAAGRFGFLWWFVPLHGAYVAFLTVVTFMPNLTSLLRFFFAFGIVRLVFVLSSLVREDNNVT